MSDLDIVIPVYNSALTLPNLIQRLNELAQSTPVSFRVVFVDDGSVDNSREILSSLPKNFEFKLVQLARNYGQHTATAIGLGLTNAPLVATIDDDLQHDPFEIDKLLKQLKSQDADLVFGSYEQKQHSVIRNCGSWLLKKIFLMDGLDYSGVTSFRLMKSHVAHSFRGLKSPIVFIEEYLIKSSRKTTVCEVVHMPRMVGKSSYSSWKLF